LAGVAEVTVEDPVTAAGQTVEVLGEEAALAALARVLPVPLDVIELVEAPDAAAGGADLTAEGPLRHVREDAGVGPPIRGDTARRDAAAEELAGRIAAVVDLALAVGRIAELAGVRRGRVDAAAVAVGARRARHAAV